MEEHIRPSCGTVLLHNASAPEAVMAS
jgi:two-component system osmolarity sensor histidine kinase EnvZ